jgi:hypothetical protein
MLRMSASLVVLLAVFPALAGPSSEERAQARQQANAAWAKPVVQTATHEKHADMPACTCSHR